MEYEGGASVISYQWFPGEPAPQGQGGLQVDGLKGPVIIPADYYSDPEIYDFPDQPTPYDTEETRGSLALYDYRNLASESYAQPSLGQRRIVRAPRTWRDPQIFDPTDPAGAGQTVELGQAVETDLAQAVAWAPKRRLVAQALETDLAQAIASLKTKAIAQASETDLAQAIARRKTKLLGQSSETDLAQTVTRPGAAIPVAQALETDLAQAIASRKTKTVAQALETDLAQAIGRIKIHNVLRALETDLAQIVTRVKSRVIGQASETDSAQGIVKRKLVAILQALETDLAQAIAVGGVEVAYILSLIDIVASASVLLDVVARQSSIDDVAGTESGIVDLKALP